MNTIMEQAAAPPSTPSQQVTASTRRSSERNATSTTTTFFYVEENGSLPTVSNWTNYVVIIPAHVSNMDGPAYGLLDRPASVPAKTKKGRTVPDPAWTVQLLVGSSIEGPTYCLKKSSIEFSTRLGHESEAESSLYRFGRVLLPTRMIVCVQVVNIRENEENQMVFVVSCRGNDPKSMHWDINPQEFVKSSQAQFMTGFGHGSDKMKKKNLVRWGDYHDNMLGKTTDIQMLLQTPSVPPLAMRPNETLSILDPHGEIISIDIDQYIVTDILQSTMFGMNEEMVNEEHDGDFDDDNDEGYESAHSYDNSIGNVKANLNFESSKTPLRKRREKTSSVDSIDGSPHHGTAPATAASASTRRPVHPPRYTTVPSGPAPLPVPYNKHGVNMSAMQMNQHNVCVKPYSINEGKWDTMTIDSRADWILRQEILHGTYNANKTSSMIILLANLGVESPSYFLSSEKVPSGSKQALPSKKWTTVEEPLKWIETMADLVDALRTMAEVAGRYFRPDIAQAITCIYNRSHEWVDLGLPQKGVNAYRDLYSMAVDKAIESAVDGYTGSTITRLCMAELHPMSDSYTATITNRLNRIDAGKAWGHVTPKKTSSPTNPSGTPTPTKDRKTMTEEQKKLVPTLADGKQQCLAFNTIKGCVKSSEACKYSHIPTEIPKGLRNYARSHHGRSK